MTPHLSAVALYTGLLALVAIWIGFRVGALRGKEKITIGDGGNQRLIRAMRGHSNFTENVPLALIIMLLLAMFEVPIYAIHVAGIMLVIGRMAHAWHFTQEDAPGWQRGLGAITSTLVIVFGGIGLVVLAALQAI